MPQIAKLSQGLALLLASGLVACGQDSPPNRNQGKNAPEQRVDPRAEFLRLAAGDPWAKWPDNIEDPVDDGQDCARVTEKSRDDAIELLEDQPAVTVDALQFERLTGLVAPAPAGQLYLLRGFSTTNSAARVKVIEDVVVVHSDALGGLSNLRRHPCVAALRRDPTEVYTVIAYDL